MPDLSLIIRAMFEGSDEVTKAKDGVQGLADAAGEVGDNTSGAEQPLLDFGSTLTTALGMAGVIAVGVKAVAEGITMVIDSAREAAGLEFATMQFENLSASIGETSDAIIKDLRTATQGLVSDADLQAGAAMLISSGYAHSSEELANFAEIAVGLDVPLTDMAKLVSGTGTSLKNMGIDISGVNDRVDELVNAGWDKSAAQIVANTEAMQQHIDTVGSAAESEMALFKRLDAQKANSAAATDNVTASTGRLLVEMQLAGHEIYQSELAYADLRSQLVENNIAFDEEKAVFQSFFSTVEEKNAALESMAVKLYGAEYALSLFSAAELEMIGNTYDATSSYGEFISAAESAGINVDNITESVYEAIASIIDLNSTPLEDKDATVEYEIDDSDVQAYTPPNKRATIDYQIGYIETIKSDRAVGGAVYGGNPYTWQEYGYKGELFVPSSDGFILSRADAERALSRALTGGGSAVDPEAIGKAVARALSGITSGKSGGGNVYNLTMPTSSNPADVRTAFELMEAWGA